MRTRLSRSCLYFSRRASGSKSSFRSAIKLESSISYPTCLSSFAREAQISILTVHCRAETSSLPWSLPLPPGSPVPSLGWAQDRSGVLLRSRFSWSSLNHAGNENRSDLVAISRVVLRRAGLWLARRSVPPRFDRYGYRGDRPLRRRVPFRHPRQDRRPRLERPWLA